MRIDDKDKLSWSGTVDQIQQIRNARVDENNFVGGRAALKCCHFTALPGGYGGLPASVLAFSGLRRVMKNTAPQRKLAAPVGCAKLFHHSTRSASRAGAR